MLLSDRDLRAELETGRVRLLPYDAEMLQPSSVDVRLSGSFRVFENHRYPHIDPAVEQPELTRLVEPEDDEPFILHPGEFVLGSTLESVSLPDDIAARLEGKALAVTTPVPTPEGWRTMGDLRPGDRVFDETGEPCEVRAVGEVMVGRPCREVHFSDGSVILADASHRWLTVTGRELKRKRPGKVRTTDQIRDSLRAPSSSGHHVALAGPVRYPEQELPENPYLLGRRLASPHRRGISEDGCVPEVCLRGDRSQRLAFLQGLMDAGGRVDESGRAEFSSRQEELADAVLVLGAGLRQLPVKHKVSPTGDAVEEGPVYQVVFRATIPVFRDQARLDAMRTDGEDTYRAIVAVHEVPSVAVRCIEVSSPTGLFLVGPTYIATHNSSLGRLGLLTHSTAGFVDPGFTGHVTLELSNVATLPIKLWPGMKIGQMCFFRLSSPAEHPYGDAKYGSRYQGQQGPTPSRSHLNFRRGTR